MTFIASSLMFLLFCFTTLSDVAIDNFNKSFFLHFYDFNNPKTLKDKISEAEARVSADYFVAFTNATGRVERVEQISRNKVKMTFAYSYSGKRVSKLTSFQFHEGTFTKCDNTYKKKVRNTACYDEAGALVSKESYNKLTRNYSVEKFDSTGKIIWHEWGKF